MHNAKGRWSELVKKVISDEKIIRKFMMTEF